MCLVGAGTADCQVQHEITSEGSIVVVNSWPAQGVPAATVLLVPGWGGGPTDALGIAAALSAASISVVVLTPRGWHESEGTATFANALEDIGTAVAWSRSAGRQELEATDLVVGGYSWGGGMSLAYAALDPEIMHVFSISGTDHGQFIRQCQSDPDYARMIEEYLDSTVAPQGPIRFDVEYTLSELAAGQDTYGLLENTATLADRSILLLGGWEDVNVTVDGSILPFYRKLRAAGANDVTLEVLHADHGFGGAREELHAVLIDWIRR